MKKIVAILMLLVMAFSVTGCKTGKNEPLQKEVEKLEAKAEKAEKEKKKAETKEAEKAEQPAEAKEENAE